MCPDFREVDELVKYIASNPFLQYSFLQGGSNYYFFISHNIKDYRMEKFAGFKSLLSLSIIRDMGSSNILGYKIRPKSKNFVSRKNYMMIYGSNINDAMYNDFTGFPGLQLYFNNDSIMLVSNKITNFYDSIESIL